MRHVVVWRELQRNVPEILAGPPVLAGSFVAQFMRPLIALIVVLALGKLSRPLKSLLYRLFAYELAVAFAGPTIWPANVITLQRDR
jgi:hypothetical protein